MIAKRIKKFSELVDRNKIYDLKEAVSILKKAPKVKFDETVELAFNLNVDPKQSGQLVRGTVILPHGSGKNVRVIVFCRSDKQNEAREAKADSIGADDLIQKVAGGWLDFDVAIAEPQMMKDLGKLGKILGPRGLMPNPKAGTVTTEIGKAVKEAKAGKVEFKTDKSGNINLAVGKISFSEAQIIENVKSVVAAVRNTRPSAVKGQFIKGLSISTTMGPGLKLDVNRL
jgi:large subunit ribosomal protein L1